MESILLDKALDNFSESSQSVVIEGLDPRLIEQNRLSDAFDASPSSFAPNFDVQDIPSSIRGEWESIQNDLNLVIKNDYQTVIERSKKCIKALNKANQRIKIYQQNNNKIISKEFRDYITTSKFSIEIYKKLYLSVLFVANKILRSKKPSKKVESLNEYLEYIHLKIIPSMNGRSISLGVIFFLSDVLESISGEDSFKSIRNLRSNRKSNGNSDFSFQIERFRENIEINKLFISYLNAITSRISEFSDVERSFEANSNSASNYTNKADDSVTYKAIQSCLDNWDEWADAMDTLARI